MNEQTHEVSDLSRRRFLRSTAVGLAAASTLGLGANTGKANESSAAGSSTIPELAPQWKKLDLAEILSRPAAFVLIRQNKSLYESWGAQVPKSIVNGPVCRPQSKSSTPRGRPITSGRLVGSATKSFARTTRNQRSTRFNTKPGSRD